MGQNVGIGTRLGAGLVFSGLGMAGVALTISGIKNYVDSYDASSKNNRVMGKWIGAGMATTGLMILVPWCAVQAGQK